MTSHIQVTQVTTDGDDVIVSFIDGHIAIFEPYTHGWGYQVEGLRRFHLKFGRQTICSYNSRLYRSGPQEDEHKIKKLEEGWTQQQVAAYWGAARTYLRQEYMEKSEKQREQRLWYPWMLVCTEGGSDHARMQKGVAEFLTVE